MAKKTVIKEAEKIQTFGFFCYSHVAYLINQGVDPLFIKERLGHKDIQITLNTYGHLYPNQQKEVTELLDKRH